MTQETVEWHWEVADMFDFENMYRHYTLTFAVALLTVTCAQWL